MIPSRFLKRDITLDYGFISVVKEITLDQLIGTYKLVYDEESEDWFYPIIYPSKDNAWN